jgi:hypothetical protein
MGGARPSEAQRQAGEAVGFGGPGVRGFKLLRWLPRQNAARTVLGYIDVELPSGLQIFDIRLGVGPKGKHYILPPAEQLRDRDGNLMLDERGKPKWFPHVGYRNNQVRDHFQDRVLAAVRARHPELFSGGDER